MRTKIKLGVIQSTKDYDIFRMHDTNRVVTNEQGFVPRPDLLKSMANGFWKSAPISCVPNEDGSLTVVDGHNRLVTARHYGIPVEYFVSPVTGSPTPIEYSVAQKAWGQGDVARGYAQQGNLEYAEVVEFAEQTGIPLNSAFSLFYGELASSHNCYPRVKAGTFVIKDRITPWKLAQLYIRICSITPMAKTTIMLWALSKALCAKGFDKEVLVERVMKNPRMVLPCRTVGDCLTMLEEIYNRSRKTEKYYLVVEVEKAMRQQNFATRTKEPAPSGRAKTKH